VLHDLEQQRFLEKAVPHRHAVPIDRIALRRAGLAGRKVGHDLVAVEIEVDPVVGAAALGAAEELPVEAARRGQVMYGKSEVEWG